MMLLWESVSGAVGVEARRAPFHQVEEPSRPVGSNTKAAPASMARWSLSIAPSRAASALNATLQPKASSPEVVSACSRDRGCQIDPLSWYIQALPERGEPTDAWGAPISTRFVATATDWPNAA